MNKQLRIQAENDTRRVLLLSLFLLLGLLAGSMLAGTLPEEERTILQEYILARRESMASGQVSSDIPQTLWAYYRTAVLLSLLSFSTAAVVPVLFLCTARSFCLAYTVGAFTTALGREGLLLALATLGFRCLFTLPATLYLAGATVKAALQPGAESRAVFGKRALYAALYLCLGAVLELTVSPLLLRLFFSD